VRIKKLFVNEEYAIHNTPVEFKRIILIELLISNHIDMTTRICSQCNIEKPLTEDFFHHNGRGDEFRRNCKECQSKKQNISYEKNKNEYKKASNDYRKELRKQNQILLWEFFLNNPCKTCGETNPVVLELDHLRDKEYNVSQIIFCHKWESVQKEIAKCQVLCANCHRKKTAKDFGHYRHINGIKDFL